MFPRVCRFLPLLFGLVLFALADELSAQNALIPLTNHRGMVFDHAGNYLYISTSDGFVRRYNLATKQIDNSYNLGGSLNGIDIAPDDSILLIAQNNTANGEGTFHRIDLTTSTVTDIHYSLSQAPLGEAGAWDVAIASNGLAFATTQYSGDGWTPLHQINLTTNAITIRTDVPGTGPYNTLGNYTAIRRNNGGTALYFLQGGAAFVYRSDTNIFSAAATGGPGWGDINRTGTLLVNANLSGGYASLDTTDFQFVRSLPNIDGDVAFSPTSDVVFGVNAPTAEIIAYDSRTFIEQFRLPVGESVFDSWRSRFDQGLLVASPNGRYLAVATPSGIRVLNLASIIPSPSPSPIPTFSTRRGMVFDHSGRFLYVTTTTGLVERYNLATAQLEIAYDVGGKLNGIDIAPDDSFLLIAQEETGVAQAVYYKVDLRSGAIVSIGYRPDSQERGAWDVAIMSNGLAFVTTTGDVGQSPLRQIDLATNAITVRRQDLPGFEVVTTSLIHRSADRGHFWILNNGVIITYDATTNAFQSIGGAGTGDWYTARAALNRNATLVATRRDNGLNTALDSLPDIHYLRSFSGLDGDVAFDATTDTLYGVNSVKDQIIAYNAQSFHELFRIDIGETLDAAVTPFGTGSLAASHDGRYIALETPSGVKLWSVPPAVSAQDPSPNLGAPRDMVFDSTGHYLYVTTSTGLVVPLNLTTQQVETPYDLGGTLNAIDIAPDDSFVLIAQNDTGVLEGTLHKLFLKTQTLTNVTFQARFSPSGAWNLAISPNGYALVSLIASTATVSQLDLSTETLTDRTDVPNYGSFFISGRTKIRRSADRSRFYFLEPNDSSGPVFTFSSAANAFGPRFLSNGFLDYTSAAVSRDGSILGTRLGTSAYLNNALGFQPLHTFSDIDSGIAFDARKDSFYGVSSTAGQIVAYNTTTYAEQGRWNIGEPVPAGAAQIGGGRLVASQDGHFLALITPTTVRTYNVLNGTMAVAPPTISPSGGAFKKSVTVKMSCATNGAAIHYTLDGSNPTSSSATYSTSKKFKGIKITGKGPHTVKAIGTENGFADSSIASATFTIN